MNFDYNEEQTLLDNMVTSFVRDNYDWDTRCSIVKTESGWKEENWKQNSNWSQVTAVKLIKLLLQKFKFVQIRFPQNKKFNLSC